MTPKRLALAILRLLGLLLASGGRLQAAAACYRRALALCPGHPGAATDLAACLSALGQSEAALALCLSARQAGADDPWLHNNIGRLQALAGDHAAALRSYAAALVQAPGLAATWANLGATLLALDQPRLALLAYRRALALAPALSGAGWGEAACLERLGHSSAATAAYNRALGAK